MPGASDPLGGALDAKDDVNADVTAASRGALLEGEEVKFNARVPKNLRDAFADVCESEGRSMSWVIRRWMLQAVEKGETGL